MDLLSNVSGTAAAVVHAENKVAAAEIRRGEKYIFVVSMTTCFDIYSPDPVHGYGHLFMMRFNKASPSTACGCERRLRLCTNF